MVSRTYRATHCLHSLLSGKVLRKAKINHFDAIRVILAGKHEILRLDVSMADVLSVQVSERRKKLMHDQRCLPLAQMLPLDDKME